jgi:adenosylhomocysteine nucleosidase
MDRKPDVVVIISANVEWAVIRQLYPDVKVNQSPFGEWFFTEVLIGAQPNSKLLSLVPVVFIHGGWGKISAAASAQYVVDLWCPDVLVNLGTCGGFEGLVERGEIILVNRTLVYDIYEQMGDPEYHIAYYTTDIDLNWLEEDYPSDVLCTNLVSGDQDLVPGQVTSLNERYHAIAGDWESGAIAWVANRNKTRCLILRGVSDLVGAEGGEAYENKQVFVDATGGIIRRLVHELPLWIAKGLSRG